MRRKKRIEIHIYKETEREAGGNGENRICFKGILRGGGEEQGREVIAQKKYDNPISMIYNIS